MRDPRTLGSDELLALVGECALVRRQGPHARGCRGRRRACRGRDRGARDRRGALRGGDARALPRRAGRGRRGGRRLRASGGGDEDRCARRASPPRARVCARSTSSSRTARSSSTSCTCSSSTAGWRRARIPSSRSFGCSRSERFPNAPRLQGVLETPGPPLETVLASVTSLVPALGDGWGLTLDSLADDPSWLPERAWRLGEVTAGLHSCARGARQRSALRAGGAERRGARARRGGDRRGDLGDLRDAPRATTRSAPSRIAPRTSATSCRSSSGWARPASRSARTATTTSARCSGRPTATGS